MDGFGSNSGVIVMAATNRPETLDPALLRPGRFDRHVLVDRPDVRGREAILKVHVLNVKLDPKVNIEQVARITSGFCGADLANLVNEAALLAARNNKKSVGMVEFNEAVERGTAGLEKKKRVIHEDEKKRVAYHEAAHALVAYSLPNTDPIHKVSIIPRGLAALGYTMQRPEDDRYLLTQSELESRIHVLLSELMIMINDIVFLGVDIVFHGVYLVFLGVYLVLLQLRLEVIDFLFHDLGLLLDLSLDLGAKLGNPLLDVYVDGAGAAVDSAVVGGLWWRYCGRAWHSTAGDSRPSAGRGSSRSPARCPLEAPRTCH